MSKTYNPSEAESKWYSYWLDQKFFKSQPNPNKKPYTIVIPPPNVTGVLHMGHMLNNTIQDVLIRRARMQGFEACWVPGTDHASIATEAKVVAMLKEQGIDKKSLSREDFLKYAWQWKEKYGGIILDQLKQLGASCDWDRTKFTMDPDLYDAVIDVFIDLYNKGLIYKGYRMVNWDPQGKTALSDEEVIHKEVNSKLYYMKYTVVEENSTSNTQNPKFIVVATTRPETIFGDTAVCVNPNDERYQFLKGKKVIVPIVNRAVDIIFDEYVDMEFGTGCLKVTPAHDVNDNELGKKHNLEIIDAMNDDGTMATVCGPNYAGKDRFAVRKQIAKDLEAAGLLEKIEEIKNNIGHSERTNAVVESRLSSQWFVDMKKFMAKNPQVLEDVMNDTIQLHPAKFKNTYRHWLENVKDWCISRQLWWGHRIPAWYNKEGEFVVAKTAEHALAAFKAKDTKYSGLTTQDLSQDEDVMDTWFSSWLWPISVFDTNVFKGEKPSADLDYYYPTNTLVTAPEILFFWVARMIMAGYEWKGQLPFKDVYLTGIVRDPQGRKMSKSLGNSPDPLELINKYGADGVRVGMLLSSPAGNDLLFDVKYCEQGRNFWNKLWNAFRLVDMWEIVDAPQPAENKVAIDWFTEKFKAALVEIEDNYNGLRMSDALMGIYKLVWDEYCALYLEMIKPEFGKPIDKYTLVETKAIFADILKVVHPFMPFITEELWHELADRDEKDSICIAAYPSLENANETIIKEADVAFEVVVQVRNLKNSKQIPPKQLVDLHIKTAQNAVYEKFGGLIKKLAFVENIAFVSEKTEGAASFVIKGDELFVPLEGMIDPEAEREKLQKELEYAQGFLKSVEAKLSNERFVANAKPEVVAIERSKKADAEAKIKALEESLAAFK